MKKLIIAAVLILTSGILPSFTKQVTVKPTVVIEPTSMQFKKDVGTAD